LIEYWVLDWCREVGCCLAVGCDETSWTEAGRATVGFREVSCTEEVGWEGGLRVKSI
jgi:hypothetical protein